MIRVLLAFGDATFGERLFEYRNGQPDLQVCGKGEIRDEVVRGPIELRLAIAILEMTAESDLEVANAFKQHIPSPPLLPVAEEVGLETEKKAPAHGVDAVFAKEDDRRHSP